MSGAPMLKATGLWQKTSAKGAIYYVGRWGDVKILILENRDRAGDDDPTHHLFFAGASPNGTKARAPSEHERPAALSRRRSAYPRARPQEPGSQPPDDCLDDLYAR